MRTEFKWIAGKCPAFASLFTAWVDVQQFASIHNGNKALGLNDALQGFGISDGRFLKGSHHGANDAVRFLAVIAALMAGVEFVLWEGVTGKHCRIPGPVDPFHYRITEVFQDV